MRRIYFIYVLIAFLPVLCFSQALVQNLNKQSWQFHKKGEQKWLPASVPGTIHTDLLNNKLIPDPFFGDNEHKLQWIENEDWEYQTTFTILKGPAALSHVELQFDGLDTYAKVYLNDSLVLSADNMFRTWNVDVKKFIRVGENKLTVSFESSVRKGKEEAKKLSYTLPGDEKVFTRKAQYQYGWDWGPRFVTCGIWKNVKLIFWKDALITNVQCIQQSLSDSIAKLEFSCEVKSDIEGTFKLWVSQSPGKIVGKDEKLESFQLVVLKRGINQISVKHIVYKPERWWCNGYGKQKQYAFEIMLHDNSPVGSPNFKIYDTKQLTIGLRTIELVQEKDSIGSSFYFKLNGLSVFMKGANYIPPDNFLPRVTPDDYKKIIANAVDANMNMLRVWGGGVYADDEFYDLCDKNGILVWQDFMFACAMYPGDQHFMENVAKEVIDQTTRLRNHPSIALWCGNNEIDEGWKNWGWQKQYKYSEADSAKIAKDYLVLFDNFIKDIVKSTDNSRAYWPSSPSIGWGHKESLQQGDSHYWGVWWGMEPFDTYEKKVGRFVSEYGFQGMPNAATFYKMGALKLEVRSKKKLSSKMILPTIDSVVFKAHQKHPTGYQTIQTYMEREYKIPTKFADYVYVSQLLQAKGMKTAIETHRRAKPYCMGTLYWQLNDCWPVTSWSTVDYYNNWKASQYMVKRSYESVMLSVKEEKERYDVYVLNDSRLSGQKKLGIKLIDFKGKLLWNKMVDLNLVADYNVVYSVDKKDLGVFDSRNTVLSVSLIIPKALELSTTLFYFSRAKDLQLEKAQIKAEVELRGHVQCISVTTDVLAKDVYLSIDGEYVNLSDNYFDLLPAEKKIIFLPLNTVVNDLDKKIKIKSLVDTYE